MKTSNKLLLGLLVVVILVITVFMALLRSNYCGKSLDFNNVQTESSTFVLYIENAKYGAKITGLKGCAFKEMKIVLNEGQTKEIDQFGMRNPNDSVRAVKDDSLASFRIAITKFKGGLAFKGIEGTNWEKLSFSCPSGCYRLIGQNGIR